ncbi:MAG: DUF4149 domain-containing protein [Massilia sp.]
MLAAKARLLLVVLWAGSLWTMGYVAAPTLFATLHDTALAGTIAGSLLRSEAWLSLVVGVLVMGMLAVAKDVTAQRRKLLLLVAGAMLVGVLVNYLGLWPVMAEARLAGDRSKFGMLHGISMVIYLVQAVLAGVLVVKNP